MKKSGENIKVVCRFRPPNKYEQKNSQLIDMKIIGNKSIEICEKKENTRNKDHKFTFDYVFDTKTAQNKVFDVVAKPVLEGVFDGWNGSILAYGQTSSGKTFTMQGNMAKDKLKGIVPRLINSIFDFIYDSPEHLEFIVKISMLEIYMENIRDLLNPNQTKKVRIRQSPNLGVKLDNLTEICVGDELEVESVFASGISNRKIGRTNMNAVSSRSHMVSLIQITQTDTIENNIKKGKLYLIDLAGSEKVNKSGAKGLALEEAKLINKSLFALGNVINALTENESFVPYRNSKLTKILQETFGGNSRTTLIITCSPAIYNLAETVSTLKFGMRAKTIKNKTKINEELSKEQLIKNLNKANLKINYLDGYVSFLKHHIKHKLGAPLPKYKGNTTGLSDIQKTNIKKGLTSNIGGVSQEVVKEFEKKIKKYEQDADELKKQIESFSEKNENINLELQQALHDLKDKQTEVDEIKQKLLFEEQKSTQLRVSLENLEKLNQEMDMNFDKKFGKMNLDNLDLEDSKILEDLINNIKASDKERSLLKDYFGKFQLTFETQKNEVFKMRTITQGVLENYQQLVETELPELEKDHKNIIESLKKREKNKILLFNGNLINIVNSYIDTIALNTEEIRKQKNKIKENKENFNNYKKITKRKILCLKNKIELLTKCINIIIQKFEDYRTKDVKHPHINLDIDFDKLDDMTSNFQTHNPLNDVVQNTGQKVIKLIRGHRKIKEANESEEDDDENDMEKANGNEDQEIIEEFDN